MIEYRNEPLERRKIHTNYSHNTLQYQFDEIYSYNQENLLLPCGYFWSFLSKHHHGPRIWVPDTFVITQADHPSVWVYSNQAGVVEKTPYRNLKDFVSKLCESEEPGNIVAVCKKPIYRNDTIVGNDVKLVRNQGVNAFLSQLPPNVGGVFVIQRFIKCEGQKPFICRTVWRKKGVN